MRLIARCGVLVCIVFLFASCDHDPMSIEIETRYFTVTYHSEGHTSGEVPVDERRFVAPTVDENGFYNWPTEPDTLTIMGQGTLEKEGFYFHGWTGRNGIGWAIEGDSFPLQENLELHAIWSETPASMYITVTYHSEGHTAGEPPVDTNRYPVFRRTPTFPPVSIARPEVVIILGPGTLEKEGHAFSGWRTRDGVFFCNMHGHLLIMPPGIDLHGIVEDTDFYAVWERLR